MQKIHYKTLKVIYQSDGSYDHLLQLSKSVSLHQRHLRFLLTEIYKSTGTLSPPVYVVKLQIQRGSTKPEKGSNTFHSSRKVYFYGTNSVHFRVSLIWNKLPTLVKSSRSISEFKNIIKNI